MQQTLYLEYAAISWLMIRVRKDEGKDLNTQLLILENSSQMK